MRRLNRLSFPKNHIKGYRCTLLNAWGAMMHDHRMLHQKWIVASPHGAYE